MLNSTPMLSSLTPHRRILLGSALGVLALVWPVSGQTAEATAPTPPTPPAPAAEVSFMRDIAPMLVVRCFSCHDLNNKEPGGDLWLDTYTGMTNGKHPAVLPGEPDRSAIIQRLTEEDSSSRMPRDDDPLAPAQIDLIRRWIQAGAKFDGPDPKTPYAKKPAAAEAHAATPHPIHLPAAPADAKTKPQPKTAESEAKEGK